MRQRRNFEVFTTQGLTAKRQYENTKQHDKQDRNPYPDGNGRDMGKL